MSGDSETASSSTTVSAATGRVAQTAQSFCRLKIPVPPGSSITDEGPIVLISLQIFL